MTRNQPRNNDLAAAIVELMAPHIEATNRRLEQIHREVQSTRGILRRGALAKPITNNQSSKISVSPGQLAGVTLHETTGAAGATVRLHDAIEAAGTDDVILIYSLVAGESARDWFLPQGIGFTNGLFLEIASGAVEGAVYLAPVGT